MALPLSSQAHKIDPVQNCLIRFSQLGRLAFLNQLYHAVTAVDLEFLGLIRQTSRSLNFRHAIRQHLLDGIFFSIERARIETILYCASERKDPEGENRHP